jgi:hypothetical protein
MLPVSILGERSSRKFKVMLAVGIVVLRRRLAAAVIFTMIALVVSITLALASTRTVVHAFESTPSLSLRATIATAKSSSSSAAAAAARRHAGFSFVTLHAARIDGLQLMKDNFKTLLVPNAASSSSAASSTSSSSSATTDVAFQEAFKAASDVQQTATATSTTSSFSSSFSSSSLPDIDDFAAELAKASSTASSNMDALMRSIQSIKTVDTSTFSLPSSKPSFAEYLTAQGVNVNDVLSSITPSSRISSTSQNWLANTDNGQKFRTLWHEMTDALLHPTRVADSAQAFGDSLVNIANILQQDAWSNADLYRALNVAETGNWYLATGAFVVFVLGATATNSMEESYKYQKHDYLIQSYLQETSNDGKDTKTAAVKNAAELMAVQNQVQQLTQATAAVADFMVQLQKDKASKDVDLAGLKLELRKLQSQLTSTKSEEQELRTSLLQTQQELKVQSASLQKDLEQRARAEHLLQTKLAATEKSLEAERARVLAAKEAAAEREKREQEELKKLRRASASTSSAAAAAAAVAAAAAAADNDAMAINNEILLALSTEKDSMIAQVETIQREMQNLRELLKTQAARQQSAAAALKAAAATKSASTPPIKASIPVAPPPPPPPAERKVEPAEPLKIASVKTAYFSATEETKKTPKTTTTPPATPTSSTKKKTTTTTLAAAKAEPEPAPTPTAPAVAAVVPPKKQVAVKGSSKSPPPEPVVAARATPPVVAESKKSTKAKKETPKAATVAVATPATPASKGKTITIKKSTTAPKQAEPKMKAVEKATVVAEDTAAKVGGGEEGDDDWSRLAASTLKRKTTTDLISYLESRVSGCWRCRNSRGKAFFAFFKGACLERKYHTKSDTRRFCVKPCFFIIYRGPVRRTRMAKYSKRICW